MQIVIEIDKDAYEALCGTGYVRSNFNMIRAVRESIPLPEHYGRLIDADAYIDKHGECGWLDDITVDEFNKITPTIIPATEEKSCATCGQPRDYEGRCILFKEGKCVDIYEKWKPTTEEMEEQKIDDGCKNCARTDNCGFYQAGHRFLYNCNQFIPKQTATEGDK